MIYDRRDMIYDPMTLPSLRRDAGESLDKASDLFQMYTRPPTLCKSCKNKLHGIKHWFSLGFRGPTIRGPPRGLRGVAVCNVVMLSCGVHIYAHCILGRSVCAIRGVIPKGVPILAKWAHTSGACGELGRLYHMIMGS